MTIPKMMLVVASGDILTETGSTSGWSFDVLVLMAEMGRCNAKNRTF